MDIDKALERVKYDPGLADQIGEIRRCDDPDKRAKLKKNLPYIIAATFNGDKRGDQHFEQTEFIDRKVPLEFINNSDNQNPEYAYVGDSGFDLKANEDVWIHPMSRNIIKTGLIFNIPDGYEIQVRSKSGIALKQGLFVLNSPGTVDSGYLGEIQVIMFNTTTEKVKIEKGQKIAQAVLCPVVGGKWVELIKVEKIEDKDRNNNGFGSTGL